MTYLKLSGLPIWVYFPCKEYDLIAKFTEASAKHSPTGEPAFRWIFQAGELMRLLSL